MRSDGLLHVGWRPARIRGRLRQEAPRAWSAAEISEKLERASDPCDQSTAGVDVSRRLFFERGEMRWRRRPPGGIKWSPSVRVCAPIWVIIGHENQATG